MTPSRIIYTDGQLKEGGDAVELLGKIKSFVVGENFF